MKRFVTIAVIAMVAIAIVASSTVIAASGGGNKATRGVLSDGDLLAYASCWTGATEFCQPVKKYSGRIWTGEGEIEGLGPVTVEVRACWDWGRSQPLTPPPPYIYTADHRGALIVTTTQGFEDDNVDTPIDGTWTANATVTITTKKGDEINGNIVGGSVYELVVHQYPDSGSINEWLISFNIDGGTGKFSSASGTGLYRMVWDSSTDGYPANPRDLTDPNRFIEQEIFLHLNK